jgi:hypothetical protein
MLVSELSAILVIFLDVSKFMDHFRKLAGVHKLILVINFPDVFVIPRTVHPTLELTVHEFFYFLAFRNTSLLKSIYSLDNQCLAAYLGIFISSIVRASKHVKDEPVLIALMAGILAYIGHNVFCYQQCICTPVVFIFIGIVEVILRSKRSKEA